MMDTNEIAANLHPGFIELTQYHNRVVAFYQGKDLPTGETLIKRGKKLGVLVSTSGVEPSPDGDTQYIIFYV